MGGNGHDFVRNPTSNHAAGAGHDFVSNPKGTTSGSAPRDFEAMAQKGAQKSGSTESSETTVPGGKLPLKDTTQGGTGSIGNSHKPFSLTGEGASASDMPPVGSAGGE